ncbi:VOC family protein [Mycolicibacterium goodii]|uniref:Putative pterin-4-alpha-carbinolamine dehydratase n=1 Tax=Mycolicibacterium goodii TaxID=134601 RepID=A0A0K0XBR1_MYCGD|nr:4a-hydroxytetrahydrobiopterin dehydratase [Mycolicibacterium goodii]
MVQLTRREVSDTVGPLGWRLVLGAVHTEVLVPSMADAARAVMHAVAAAGTDASGHLTIDVRADRVVLHLRSQHTGTVTRRDLELASDISHALAGRGYEMTVSPGAVQAFEIAIDALDIAAVRPFWQAITDYVDYAVDDADAGASADKGDGLAASELHAGLVDPFGRGPAIWFQQMDAPRPQRNRIHIDIDLPHDAAQARIDAALAAGGTLLSDAGAPSFWVLSDPEGNEACVCTWQGRD